MVISSSILFGRTDYYSILIDPGYGGTDIGALGTDGDAKPNGQMLT
jgi:N-acetylmuramoyl-L-alanine amidase